MPLPSYADLRTAVQTALQDWHHPEKPLAALWRELRLVAQQRTTQLAQNGLPLEDYQLVHQVLGQALEALEKVEAKQTQLLRLRFVEDLTAKEVAQTLQLENRDKANRLQDKALDALTQLLLQQETAAQHQHRLLQESHLPPRQYVQLFGVETWQAQAWAKLTAPTENWLLALVGLGGIGKTALADALARLAIETNHFEQVFWLRVNRAPQATPSATCEQVLAELANALWPNSAEMVQPQERRQRLRQALQTHPHLIIIDNLEVLADLTELLGQLSNLTNPSKFLLTTRVRPTGEYPVFALGLDELPQPDAYGLMRHLASLSGSHELAEAPEAQLDNIYHVVGGNPLALKLVVSLASVQPLPDVLAGLATSRAGSIENLYRHIYWKAWQALNEPARALLQAMPLVAETGGLPEQLQHMSSLPEKVFWAALEELTARSLIETRGTLAQRRYGIHRLTDTFLRTEIIHWPEDDL